MNPTCRSLILGLTLSVLSFLPVNAQSPEQSPRPNILLIMCDDLGWGDTGFNGNTTVKTPHLDALASKGITLTRFYSHGSVCSPTRASCITGRNPMRMGITTANAGHMKDEEITLPELLRAKGYATGHFGKWHLGTLTAMIHDANRGKPRDYSHYSLPTQHGYDTYFCTESKVPTWDPLIKPDTFYADQGESLRYGWAAMEEEEDPRSPQTYGTYYWQGEEAMVLNNVEGDNSRIIMDRVIPFMQKAVNAHRPFFSTIWFHTPHLPVVTGKKYRDLYPNLPHDQQLYYGTITAMDEQIGRLWQQLEAMGIADNTWIWFASDNGPERQTPGSAGPFRERKRSLYEGGVRIPAFTIWTGNLQGERTSDIPMVTSDYLPTIVDYLELDYPDLDRPLDGMSVKPLLNNSQANRNHPIGFWFRNRRSWVTDQYKLISTDDGKTYELYDLRADQEENNDLAASNLRRVEEMKAKLGAWIESCKRSEQGKDY